MLQLSIDRGESPRPHSLSNEIAPSLTEAPCYSPLQTPRCTSTDQPVRQPMRELVHDDSIVHSCVAPRIREVPDAEDGLGEEATKVAVSHDHSHTGDGTRRDRSMHLSCDGLNVLGWSDECGSVRNTWLLYTGPDRVKS